MGGAAIQVRPSPVPEGNPTNRIGARPQSNKLYSNW